MRARVATAALMAGTLLALASGCSTMTPVASPTSSSGAGHLQDPIAVHRPAPAPGVTPTAVTIPSIAVSSELVPLSLDGSGALLPPTDFHSAGWYSAGVVPGAVGPAIIAGHIDSVTAPAVFARLDELKQGDAVTVTLSNGTTENFIVQKSLESPKAAFPTSAVYGNVPTPQLRLITCGGAFNAATGHYVDNLIVYATLTN